jgi:hypothetical protein
LIFLSAGDERDVYSNSKASQRWPIQSWVKTSGQMALFLFCSIGPHVSSSTFLGKGPAFLSLWIILFSVANWTKCTLRNR